MNACSVTNQDVLHAFLSVCAALQLCLSLFLSFQCSISESQTHWMILLFHRSCSNALSGLSCSVLIIFWISDAQNPLKKWPHPMQFWACYAAMYCGLVAICSAGGLGASCIHDVNCAQMLVFSCSGSFHCELMSSIWGRHLLVTCCHWVLGHQKPKNVIMCFDGGAARQAFW
jgi:hypothetical protein